MIEMRLSKLALHSYAIMQCEASLQSVGTFKNLKFSKRILRFNQMSELTRPILKALWVPNVHHGTDTTFWSCGFFRDCSVFESIVVLIFVAAELQALWLRMMPNPSYCTSQDMSQKQDLWNIFWKRKFLSRVWGWGHLMAGGQLA